MSLLEAAEIAVPIPTGRLSDHSIPVSISHIPLSHLVCMSRAERSRSKLVITSAALWCRDSAGATAVASSSGSPGTMDRRLVR